MRLKLFFDIQLITKDSIIRNGIIILDFSFAHSDNCIHLLQKPRKHYIQRNCFNTIVITISHRFLRTINAQRNQLFDDLLLNTFSSA